MTSIISTTNLVAVVAIFFAVVVVSPIGESSVISDVAFALKNRVFGKSSYLPWHDTPEWEHFLSIYDDKSTDLFGDGSKCSSIVVATSYGPTQTHACGDAKADPVLLFHGMTFSALMFGDWLVHDIVKAGRYAVAVDFVCDCGRSAPLDGDRNNCPQDKESLAHWVQEIMDGLGIVNPASLVGYSYGAFIASTVAMIQPNLVDKIALIAPAAVVTPVKIGWVLRSMVPAVVKSTATLNWFYRYLLMDPEFDVRNHPDILAPHKVGATLVTVLPKSLNDDDLATIAKRHPMGLFIGGKETLISVPLAVERAERAGMKTKVYPHAGHMMQMEPAWDQISLDVVSFIVEEMTE